MKPQQAWPVTIDWERIHDMAKLMLLVYKYIEDWGADSFTSIISTINKDSECREELEVHELQLLTSLQKKYPKSKVLQHYTNSADLQCVVGINPKKRHITVVFGGTDSLMDCFYDLLFFKHSLENDVKVHSGFYKSLFKDDVYDKLKDLVAQQLEEHPDWSVCIAGHSLGAAVSTLSSYLLAQEFPNTQFQVFAFASPKCGNATFKKAYNGLPNVKQYRVCNGRDTVTALPTLWYSHVGDNLWYDTSAKKWHYYEKTVENNYYIYSYYNPLDHKSERYLQAVTDAHKTNDNDLNIIYHMPKPKNFQSKI
jgi:predicted lipase